MAQAISASSTADELPYTVENLAFTPLEAQCEVEKTTWAGGKIIHSILSGGSKAHVVVEPHGRLGRPVFELRSKGKLIAQAHAPGLVKHLTDTWRLNIYDGKGALLARLLPKSGAFGLARTLDIATPEGKILAYSNLFSKKGAESIQFMCPDQTEEVFGLCIDHTKRNPVWTLRVTDRSIVDSRVIQIVAAVVSHNCEAELKASKRSSLTPTRIIKPIVKYVTMGLVTTLVISKLIAG